MDFAFLAKADAATIQLEKAKRALETAKADLDTAKKAYEEILTQADEMGFPKNKLKKLTEDRVQALFENGLLDFKEAAPREPNAKRPRKAKAAALPDESAEGIDFPEDETPVEA